MTAAMMSTAEMVAMATSVMATAVTATMATLGDRKVCHGQRRCEYYDGNSQSEF
jgi:hypothetical protein